MATLSSCFNSSVPDKWLFLDLFRATFFTFGGSSLVIHFTLKCPSIVLKCFVVLSSRSLWCVSDELHSVSYSAAGYEFNVNESAVYIKSGVFKQKHS